MKQTEFSLVASTPLVIGGADPGSRAEFRPPSYRGSFRYWLRVVAGGWLRRNNDSEVLNMVESAVWGNTDLGSPIRVTLTPGPYEQHTTKILPHKNQASKPAIPENTNYWIGLACSSQVDPIIWNAAVHSALLAVTLGGVGNRSRRGFGSSEIRAVSEAGFESYKHPTSEEDWPPYIRKLLKSTHAAIKDLIELLDIPMNPHLAATIGDYPFLNELSGVYLTEPLFSGSYEALKGLMQDPYLPKKFNLGRALGGRQASPLWIKPVRMGEEWGLLYALIASNIAGKPNDYPDFNQYLKDITKVQISAEGV